MLIDIYLQNLQREYDRKRNYCLNSFEKGGEFSKKKKSFIKGEIFYKRGENFSKGGNP